MKKANYGLSLLMVLALVLMGLAPVFASPQAAAAISERSDEVDVAFEQIQQIKDYFAVADRECPTGQLEVFIEIEGVEGAALGGLSTDVVVSTLRFHASETQQPIIDFLVAEGAKVLNTFWINNLILVTLDYNLIPVLFDEFPQIESVFPNFEVTIPEPLTEHPRGETGADGEERS